MVDAGLEGIFLGQKLDKNRDSRQKHDSPSPGHIRHAHVYEPMERNKTVARDDREPQKLWLQTDEDTIGEKGGML